MQQPINHKPDATVRDESLLDRVIAATIERIARERTAMRLATVRASMRGNNNG